jgi:flagellar assembly factor FliW
VKINTSRFGEVEVDESARISIPGGLIGFPEQESYVIIRHNPESPFLWFQSVEEPDLAFVIVDPRLFKPDYEAPLTTRVLNLVQAESVEDVSVFVIVTIPPGQPEAMTANLLGPLVFNTSKRIVRQVVVENEEYSHRYPIMSEKS